MSWSIGYLGFVRFAVSGYYIPKIKISKEKVREIRGAEIIWD